jgi:hypothetical protein
MSAKQLDLLIEKAPKISEGEIVTMMNALRGRGWLKSGQLGAKTPDEKRRLRAISEASNGRIVSWPGSPGYKLFDECVPEEFLRGDNATRSAVRKMLAKWSAILRRMHGRGISFPALAEECQE